MDSDYPLVGIVVLNYNGKNCLLRCLQSLKDLQYPNFFVVIVDNDSTDHSLSLAQQKFSEYSYVKNTENKGFSGGMNIGIRRAFDSGARWVWLFNNDAITSPSALSALMEVAREEPLAGLISPLIYTENEGKLWFGKGNIQNLRMRVQHVSPESRELALKSYPSEFLTGCALLINHSLYECIGGLDESFFLYYEDADYSVRTRKAGYKTLVSSQAIVFHAEQSQMSSQKLYHLVFSGLVFFKKHATFFGKLYFLVYGTIRRLKNAVDVIFGKKQAKMVRQAYRDYYHESAIFLNRNR